LDFFYFSTLVIISLVLHLSSKNAYKND